MTALAVGQAARAEAAVCAGDCDGDGVVGIEELTTGVTQSLSGFASSSYCAAEAFDRDGDGGVTIDELIAAVGSVLRGCTLERVPFTATLDPDQPALLLTPTNALRASTVYAVVVTTRVKDPAGQPVQAAPAFYRYLGRDVPSGDGPVALYDTEATAVNPYPGGRYVRGYADGRIGVYIPDAVALRGLPDEPGLATARRVLRDTADAVGPAGLFSTTAPVRIPLSAPIDLPTVTSETVLFYRPARQTTRLGLLLPLLERGGHLMRRDIAVATVFPTQVIEDGLIAVRDRLDERATGGSLRVILSDPDPSDDLAIGVFHRGAPELADFFAANPDVGTVVHGLLPSPDFRGPDEVFDPRKLSGEEPAADALLDFYLTLPGSPGPHRVVILQHGFGGSNEFGLTVANELAREGLAGMAISAVSHGRRGSPLDLLSSTALQVRDIFRQTIADQLALVRAVQVGVDADGDGASDLQPSGFGYLGVSLGGILGATFIAVEPSVQMAVLNVAGGRVAFLGNNPGTRPIFAQFLATQAQLDVDSPEFETFLQRMFELGQQGLDPADPLNYARRWRREPFAGFAPRRVLMQEGIGDLWVNNDSTEALAAAGGLVADEAMSDREGVSGLWRFEPPGGHGIFGRPDVREQAVHFLASGGTEIIAREDCESSAACTGAGQRCVEPGGCVIPPRHCGRPPQCSVDADCAARAAGSVCEQVRGCGCLPPRRCVLGCTSEADCATGEQCDGGHCVAKVCADDGDCPAQFSCSADTCARRICAADAECDSGYCVLGRCFDTLGRCDAPPP